MEKINFSGEHWLENLQGLKWTPELERAIHNKRLFEIQLLKTEDNLKMMRQGKFDRLHEGITESVIVAALKSEDNPVIKEIGVNCFDDLFTDNFGVWFASQILQSPGVQISNYIMTDTTNNQRLTGAGYMSLSGWWNAYYQSGSKFCGFQFQFGSGTTAATRGDYRIQQALGTAPESAAFGIGYGNYAQGTIVSAAAVVAGGSGTVNEVSLIGVFTSNIYFFLLSHDILASGVGYSPGNPLVCSLSIGI